MKSRTEVYQGITEFTDNVSVMEGVGWLVREVVPVKANGVMSFIVVYWRDGTPYDGHWEDRWTRHATT